MEPILSLFSLNPAPLLPASLLGWLGWLVFLGLLVWLGGTWRFYQAAWDRAADRTPHGQPIELRPGDFG